MNIQTLQENVFEQCHQLFFNSIHPNQRILLPLNIGNQQEATWGEGGKERLGGKQTTFNIASTCYLMYLHTILSN